ncbi:hypothetical protein SAMN04487969_10753 [Paenibacillus algorifonticola]|uniref:Uncharacterized protein n=1 Tax=Paenibacillus algorifonticola TaxID=684063 RepID=A0A1I2DK05_9BACL|nr:hypothetical protein [Paenibacillus algorifonticola]SFE80797.1 hypothetical protein SAMN04487969_10753 [Paenibacillus algorifonticola]
MPTKENDIGENRLAQQGTEQEWLANQLKYSNVQRGKKGDTIYLTAADFTLTSEYLSDQCNYVIHADTVCLLGELKTKGRDITINARIISSEGEAVINASGEKPAINFTETDHAKEGTGGAKPGQLGSDGADGRYGSDGYNGGAITLAAERFELKGELKLIANGGQGGRGENGGNGGIGCNGIKGTDYQINLFFDDDPTPGSDGGNGGEGGNAGASGNGGNGGDIVVGYVISANEHYITMESEAGKAGEQATPGKGASGGKGGQGGWYYYKKIAPVSNSRGIPTSYYVRSETDRAKDGIDGTNGKDGEYKAAAADGRPGRCGMNSDGRPAPIDYTDFFGSFDVVHRSDASKLLVFDQRLMGSLEQKSLTLHKASIAYLASSEERLEEAAVLLSWLLKTMPNADWFEELRYAVLHEVQDDQAHRFEDFKSRMLEVSLQWLALRNKAAILIAQLSQGLDYFGHPWNWVPLMPFDRYLELGGNLITAAQQAEDLYKDYLSVQGNQDSRVRVIKDALAQSSDKAVEIKKHREFLVKERDELKHNIDAMLKDVNSKGEELQTKATAFVEALKNELRMESLKITVDIIVTCVALATGVAPVVGSLRAGSALASAISNLASEGKTIVIDEAFKSDKTIKKEKKEKEKELSKSLDSVKKTAAAGRALWEKGGGLIDLTKQMNKAQDDFGYNTTLMTMSREDFEEMLKPVYSKVPEKAGEYRKAFYEFLNVVEDYQNKSSAYSAYFLEDEKLSAELIELHANEDRLRQNLGDGMDASLPLFHNYIFERFSQARLALIDFLYQEYQAFRYMTLGEERFPKIKDSHIAELSGIHADAVVKLKNMLNASESAIQPFENIKFIFKEETFPEQFAALRAGDAAVFSLSLDNNLIRSKIAGKAHMMVSGCRIVLPGVRDTDGEVYIDYTQSGSSTFLDREAKRHDFIHKSSNGLYQYEVSLQPEGEKISFMAGGVVGDGRTRIMPGLLSVWSIKVPTVDLAGMSINEGVNLNNVNRIEMVVEGKAEAYAVRRTTEKLQSYKMAAKPIWESPDHEAHAIAPNSEQEIIYTVIEL